MHCVTYLITGMHCVTYLITGMHCVHALCNIPHIGFLYEGAYGQEWCMYNTLNATPNRDIPYATCHTLALVSGRQRLIGEPFGKDSISTCAEVERNENLLYVVPSGQHLWRVNVCVYIHIYTSMHACVCGCTSIERSENLLCVVSFHRGCICGVCVCVCVLTNCVYVRVFVCTICTCIIVCTICICI